MSSLYILVIKTMSEVAFANIYFPHDWFPFHFADVFFSCAEAFHFDEVPLFNSFFHVLCSRGHISEDVAMGMSEVFLLMFSSRTLMVSQLIFKSFTHLEFIFVYGVSWRSSFIFCT